MDHQELHDALAWLRGAVLVAETTLRGPLPPEERAEWESALSHKRELLRKLELLNETLSRPEPAPLSRSGHECSGQDRGECPSESPSWPALAMG